MNTNNSHSALQEKHLGAMWDQTIKIFNQKPCSMQGFSNEQFKLYYSWL